MPVFIKEMLLTFNERTYVFSHLINFVKIEKYVIILNYYEYV